MKQDTPPVVLYLDIDDTLVRHPPSGPRAAPGAAEFFAWALENFQVRWLTHWCRDGVMTEDLVHSFCKMLGADPETVRSIRGVDWSESDSKLDGIAWLDHVVLGRPFVWIEDEHGLGEKERAFVELHGFAEACIYCNVTQDPEALQALHRRLLEGEGTAAVVAATNGGGRMSGLGLPHGVEMPRLGLGTFELLGAECERVVADALALGYRHVDTAEGYGNEVEVGRALRASGLPRQEVFVTSKVWRDHLTPPLLRRQLEGTLRRLGTDHLDLYLVHWPNSAVPAAETAAGMEALREEGLLRTWGVSNYTAPHLEELLRHAPVATNQIELHPYFRQEALTRYCRDRGIAITGYTPLARGLVADDPVLLEIAGEHGRTAAQIALAWALGKGHAVVPKASGREHLADNLGALDVRLSAAEVERIDTLPESARIFEYKWSEFDWKATPAPRAPQEPTTGPRAPLEARGRRASRSRSPRSPADSE